VEGEGFGAHPLNREALALLAHDMKANATRALDVAASERDRVPENAHASIQQLLDARPDLLRRFDAIAALDDAGMRIRVHGDLHLGQILEVEGDIYFVDFEGEPARPIAERTTTQSPLRDIAGMLRSFSYAARAGFRIFLRNEPESRLVRDPWIRAWETAACAIFLRSYLKHMGEGPLLPGPQSRATLLAAFLLDKALYEFAYELGNRPDWIDIPLAGLLQLVDPASVRAASFPAAT
jgi:maltose alpha-D-glucosyltransferase/alpha-amylase